MQFTMMLLAVVLCFTASIAHSVGIKKIVVPADNKGPAINAVQWSPCSSASGEILAGPFVLLGVRDCPVAGEHLPLIIISHGFGGSSLSHHDTATALANAGFIVVSLNHPDDTSTNKTRFHNLKALITRPMDVKRLINFMLTSSPDVASINPNSIGFFGFSRGGYTGLVLAGAAPDFEKLLIPCSDRTGATCDHANIKQLPMLPPSSDPRIMAYVIADPLSNVFVTSDSLKHITKPIELWASQEGGHGVSPKDVPAIAHNLPMKPTFHLVPNAGHFSFLTTCPPKLAKTLPELCIDKPNFDRAAFHKKFNTDMIYFFRKNLIKVP
ncbi:alpha/beta hydrolase family protein [Agarivorans sp. Z349TD_8]|uniref:alpha/beta hydrolase family protein n=1 Tax=Agarivorans sp. Z349TD_8 TaxID=3421434 RepID=UPI003D7DCE82